MCESHMVKRIGESVLKLWKEQYTANPTQGWSDRKLEWSLIRDTELGTNGAIVSDGSLYKYLRLFKTPDAEPVAAITVASEPAMVVDAFMGTNPTFTPEASSSDDMANLLLMQSNLAGWARENEDEANQLRELAYKVSNAIEALEQAQYLAQAQYDRISLQTRLDSANAQLQTLQDIIDREREAKRRGDNPTVRGD